MPGKNYQKSNETYEYPKEKDSKNPKTQHIKEGTQTERRLRKGSKRRRKELKEKLEDQIREWSQGGTKKDEITENAKKVLTRL